MPEAPQDLSVGSPTSLQKEAPAELLLHIRSLVSSLPRSVLLATFFHDIVYDPTRADNEEASADLALALLRQQAGTSGHYAASVSAQSERRNGEDEETAGSFISRGEALAAGQGASSAPVASFASESELEEIRTLILATKSHVLPEVPLMSHALHDVPSSSFLCAEPDSHALPDAPESHELHDGPASHALPLNEPVSHALAEGPRSHVLSKIPHVRGNLEEGAIEYELSAMVGSTLF